MEGEKGSVCVTGGTGFLASWLIMKLFHHGYSVHTTIRYHPGHEGDISFLTNLQGATEKLKIFEADLSEPESFEAAIKGCIGVFHVATPVDFKNKEAEEVVTKTAIDGTLGILKQCLKSNTVKRVVYTSSASAVVFNDKAGSVDAIDESFWSDVDFIKSFKYHAYGYTISKTLTEKTALDFAQKHGLDLVTIIPSFINGPFFCPKFPGSVRTCLAMILGEKNQYMNVLNIPMVHIDDVARAHIFLFENPNAKGRYICSSHTIPIEEMVKFLPAKYPEFPIPTIESINDIEGYRIAELSSKNY